MCGLALLKHVTVWRELETNASSIRTLYVNGQERLEGVLKVETETEEEESTRQTTARIMRHSRPSSKAR